MSSGLFILLQDEESLQDCVYNGFYGFLMPPVYDEQPSSQSKHYAALADYACCETGTEIFFFTRRSITYGGRIIASNNNGPVFYLNGDTSPIGRKANSKKYIDLSNRYDTVENGVYYLGKNTRGEDRNRAMPFIIEFNNKLPLSGKQITSDELYFKLGDYNYPFPSNSIQKRGMCTLTPKETEILLDLMKESDTFLDFDKTTDIVINDENKKLFDKNLIVSDKLVNESHLEFKLLADKEYLDSIVMECFPDLTPKKYVHCRQVPLCPFRPIQFDLADICLYDEKNSINNRTLPNIVIELKKADNVSYAAYNQTTKYLRWLKQISGDDFDKVRAIILAPDFSKNMNINNLISRGINLEFKDKIVLYSLNRKCVVDLE